MGLIESVKKSAVSFGLGIVGFILILSGAGAMVESAAAGFILMMLGGVSFLAANHYFNS